MTTQYQAVLFFVFIGFFVLIGLVSLMVLLGYPKSADPRLRQWAIPGFLVAVTTAVVTLFKFSFTSVTVAPIVVTLVAPSGAVTPSPLKGGAWEYDKVGQDQVKIVTHSGSLTPVLGEGGSWQVQLPGESATSPTRLHLQDENGDWWQVGPFFPNYVRQEMRSSKPFEPAAQSLWSIPGVAVLAAAEAGAQQQAGIRFNNYARRTGAQYGRPYYEWRVFVDEPPAVLQTIEQVDYALHPTFPDPFRTTRNRDKAFELVTSGWGEFTIVATVHFTNGKEAKAGYSLNLSKPWPSNLAKQMTAPINP
jgi:pYEATS domain-containing protein involved in immunity